MFLDQQNFNIVQNLIREIEWEQKMMLPGSNAIVRAKFEEISIHLVRNYQVKYDDHDQFGNFLTEILNYIEDNYHKEIRIDLLARKAGMSYRNFQRKFKQTTGLTPICYIIEKRLNKAWLLLYNSDKTLDEVAFETGFCNSNYMAKLFKKKHGVSPKNLRKSINST